MSDAAADDGALVAEAGDGQPKVRPQVPERGAAHVAQLHPLEVLPDAFVRVQLRRIGRQRFQLEARRRSCQSVSVVVPPRGVFERRGDILRLQVRVICQDILPARYPCQ
jgi:hypothetical protein